MSADREAVGAAIRVILRLLAFAVRRQTWTRAGSGGATAVARFQFGVVASCRIRAAAPCHIDAAPMSTAKAPRPIGAARVP